MKPERVPTPERTRDIFDVGELLYARGDREAARLAHTRSENVLRYLPGFSHPETARSIARTGDLLKSASMEGACGPWA
jgi:hypothetical protein